MFPIHLAVSEIHLHNERLFTGIIRDISDVKAVEKKLVQNERLAAIGQMMTGLAQESRKRFAKESCMLIQSCLRCSRTAGELGASSQSSKLARPPQFTFG